MKPEHEALKLAAEKATPGPWTVEPGDGELDFRAKFATKSKVLVFSEDDCEHHPIADFSCNHSCRMDFEQEHNALYCSLANPAAILALLAENAALRAQVEAQNAGLHKIIEMNRFTAEHKYGNAEKAESWSCVTIARDALKGIHPAFPAILGAPAQAKEGT